MKSKAVSLHLIVFFASLILTLASHLRERLSIILNETLNLAQSGAHLMEYMKYEVIIIVKYVEVLMYFNICWRRKGLLEEDEIELKTKNTPIWNLVESINTCVVTFKRYLPSMVIKGIILLLFL